MSEKLYPVDPGSGAPPVYVTRDESRCWQLWDCLQSGQINDAQWQAHLREEPGLREFVEERNAKPPAVQLSDDLERALAFLDAQEREKWDRSDSRATEYVRGHIAKLERFKACVHERLDAAGIPTHPDGPHSAEGCRVGDRLDLVLGYKRRDYGIESTRMLAQAAYAAAFDWRPMNTAPREGTVILLAVDDAPNPRHIVTTGSWDAPGGVWDCALGSLGERDEAWIEGEHEWPVTHWLPLPNGPTKAGDAQ